MIAVPPNRLLKTEGGWILPGSLITQDLEVAEAVDKLLARNYLKNRQYIDECRLAFLMAAEKYKDGKYKKG